MVDSLPGQVESGIGVFGYADVRTTLTSPAVNKTYTKVAEEEDFRLEGSRLCNHQEIFKKSEIRRKHVGFAKSIMITLRSHKKSLSLGETIHNEKRGRPFLLAKMGPYG